MLIHAFRVGHAQTMARYRNSSTFGFNGNNYSMRPGFGRHITSTNWRHNMH